MNLRRIIVAGCTVFLAACANGQPGSRVAEDALENGFAALQQIRTGQGPKGELCATVTGELVALDRLRPRLTADQRERALKLAEEGAEACLNFEPIIQGLFQGPAPLSLKPL